MCCCKFGSPESHKTNDLMIQLAPPYSLILELTIFIEILHNLITLAYSPMEIGKYNF